MKIRFLTITIAVALASVFAVQPAAAKHKTAKTSASAKKHHKKNKKKTASLVAPSAKAAPAIS
jgi:hypothetical protein